jgi:hypothetical protein
MVILPFLLQIGPMPPPVAPIIQDPSRFTAIYEGAIGQWFNAIRPYAFEIFAALAGLDLAAFGVYLGLNYNNDASQAKKAVVTKVFMIGIFLAFLTNGVDWMTSVISDFRTMGKAASGIPGLGPSVLLKQGFDIFGSLVVWSVRIRFFCRYDSIPWTSICCRCHCSLVPRDYCSVRPHERTGWLSHRDRLYLPGFWRITVDNELR